jgi:hypothetical protein
MVRPPSNRQVLVEPQHHAGTLAWRQAPQCQPHAVAVCHGVRRVADSLNLSQKGQELAPASVPAVLVQEPVEQNLPHVPFRLVWFLAPRWPGERPHQGVLQQVLGFALIATQQERVPLQGRATPMQKRGQHLLPLPHMASWLAVPFGPLDDLALDFVGAAEALSQM